MCNSDLSKGNKESLDLAVRIVLSEARKQVISGGKIFWESSDGKEQRFTPYNQEICSRLYKAIKMVEDFFKSRPIDRERYVTED